MLIIGSLNSSDETILSILKGHREEALLERASFQLKMGASILALNTAERRDEETSDLIWMMTTIQDHFPIPLCIDSPTPSIFQEVLPYYNFDYGPFIINSITAQEEKLEEVLPLAAEYSLPLVALLMDEEGLKRDGEEKVEVAERILERTRSLSIPDSQIYLDPLLFPLGVNDGNALFFLETLSLLQDRFPQVKSICGLDNISYGLPAGQLLDTVFLSILYQARLSAAMMDLTRVHGALLRALKALYGEDRYCYSYIEAYRQGTLSIFKEEILSQGGEAHGS